MEILKSIKKNTIILISITIVVMYFILRKDFSAILRDLKILDLKFVFLAFIFYLLYIVIRSYVVYKTVNKKKDFSFLESIKHQAITQFFNGITPFSTGGQPMEIYMLTKHNVSFSKSTNYILQNFVFYQIALVIFGIAAVLTNYKFHLFESIPLLRQLVLLGFIVNTIVAIVLLFISFSKKTTFNLIKVILNLLDKIHLIKNVDSKKEEWEKRIIEFHECATELRQRKSLFVFGVLLNFIALACLYVIPLFIVYALKDFQSLNIISAITSSAYVMVMGSFIPIPGASGGIEYAFSKFFGNFLTPGKNSTTLLIWRFITYYFGIILGAIMFNLDKNDKKEGK